MKKLIVGLVLGILGTGVVAFATDLTARQKLYIKGAIPESVLAEEISDRLDGVDSIAETASVIVGLEESNTMLTTFQFKDEAGTNLAVPAVVECWLSDNTDGLDLANTAGTSATTTSAGGVLIKEYTTGLGGLFATSSTGVLGIKLTQTAGTNNQYWACSTGVSKIVVSGALNFE